MKKFLFVFWFLFSLFWLVSAQEANIWSISVKYCNNDELKSSLSIVTESEVDNEICINFYNDGPVPAQIKYWFVDGILTADEMQNKACTDSDMENFWQFVTQNETIVEVPAYGSVQQIASVKFPRWMVGAVNGCLVYTISEEKNVQDQNLNEWEIAAGFDIVVRKASFVDAFVQWDISRNLILDKIENLFANKVLDIALLLKNWWDISEAVDFEWTLSNKFWYSYEITWSKIVESQSDYKFGIQVDNLPWYRWMYTLKWNLVSKWSVSFNPSLLSDDLSDPIVIPVETTILVFPRAVLWIIFGVLVLLWIIVYLSKHLTFHK